MIDIPFYDCDPGIDRPDAGNQRPYPGIGAISGNNHIGIMTAIPEVQLPAGALWLHRQEVRIPFYGARFKRVYQQVTERSAIDLRAILTRAKRRFGMRMVVEINMTLLVGQTGFIRTRTVPGVECCYEARGFKSFQARLFVQIKGSALLPNSPVGIPFVHLYGNALELQEAGKGQPSGASAHNSDSFTSQKHIIVLMQSYWLPMAEN